MKRVLGVLFTVFSISVSGLHAQDAESGRRLRQICQGHRAGPVHPISTGLGKDCRCDAATVISRTAGGILPILNGWPSNTGRGDHWQPQVQAMNLHLSQADVAPGPARRPFVTDWVRVLSRYGTRESRQFAPESAEASRYVEDLKTVLLNLPDSKGRLACTRQAETDLVYRMRQRSPSSFNDRDEPQFTSDLKAREGGGAVIEIEIDPLAEPSVAISLMYVHLATQCANFERRLHERLGRAAELERQLREDRERLRQQPQSAPADPAVGARIREFRELPREITQTKAISWLTGLRAGGELSRWLAEQHPELVCDSNWLRTEERVETRLRARQFPVNVLEELTRDNALRADHLFQQSPSGTGARALRPDFGERLRAEGLLPRG